MELKIPPPLLALIVLITGLAVEISAIVLFRGANTTVNPMKPENTVRLINAGIYKFSRNPMYPGVLLVLFSWALWLGSIINFAILLFYVWYITRFQIIPEERALRELFPGRFDAYRSRVRRWI